MKYYLDTEFDSFGGKLMSLALATKSGRSLYIVADDAEQAANAWVRENVVPILFACPVTPIRRPVGAFGPVIAQFMCGDLDPLVISDWPDDIRYFCQELITGPGFMVSLPGVRFEMKRVDTYPTLLAEAVQHNAWWDAQALRLALAPESFS